MPRLDGTGPQGLGSNTGRGMGLCNNADLSLKKGLNSGYGCRRLFNRRGICQRNRFFNQYNATFITKEEEKVLLEKQIKLLKDELTKLKAKIAIENV